MAASSFRGSGRFVFPGAGVSPGSPPVFLSGGFETFLVRGVVVDIHALIAEQRAVIEDQPKRTCFVTLGSERVEVTFSKLRGDAWRDLMDAAPPRKANQGDQEAGFNQREMPAFYPVESILVAGESVDEDTWRELFSVLDGLSRNVLGVAIYQLNIADPMARLLSVGKAGRADTSGSPANRESRRAASKGGSQRRSRATTTQKEPSPEPQ